MAAAELSEAQQKAVDEFSQFEAWDAPRLVPLDNLQFTDWNVNEMTPGEFSELCAEIEEHGFDEPVGVIPLPDEPGFYLVPSGEHRVRAAHSLEMETIPCVLKVTLTDKERDELIQWSIKRNNIRGRINAQRFAAVEKGLTQRSKVRAEVLRKRMLVKGDTLRRLRKDPAVLSNEEGGGTPSKGGQGKPDSPSDAETDKQSDTPTSSPDNAPENDSQRDARQEIRNRKRLENGFKAVWETALMDSADTVEHGYLVFAHGDSSQVHLLVDQSDALHKLVKRVVAACKKQSAKIDEFLVSALAGELPKWEDT